MQEANCRRLHYYTLMTSFLWSTCTLAQSFLLLCTYFSRKKLESFEYSYPETFLNVDNLG